MDILENKGMCICAKITKVLLIIGGLNWGLVGVGMFLGSGDSWNIVRMIFGSIPTLEAIVYILVGISAVIKIVGCKCKKSMEGNCCGAGAEKIEEKM